MTMQQILRMLQGLDAFVLRILWGDKLAENDILMTGIDGQFVD